MNFFNDEQKLTTKFAELWAASPYSAIPVDYPGEKSEPVEGKIVRFRVKTAPSKYSAVGGQRRRNFGSILVQIVVPMGNGPAEILSIADYLSTGFHKFRDGGLFCLAASLTKPEEDSTLITGVLDVPFVSDYSA